MPPQDMPPTDPILRYSVQYLGGRAVPDDLRKLLERQWRDAAAGADNRLKRAGVTLMDESLPKVVVAACAGRDDWSGATRLAHAQAMADMVRWSAFVAQDDTTSDAIGYWFGPDHVPIGAAPLLRFGTKFNFSILPGRDMAEAILAVAARGDAQRFCELRDCFNALGLAIAARSIQEVETRVCAIVPQSTYQHLIQVYSADLGAASVPDIGEPGEIVTIHRGPKIDLETD